MTSEKIASDDGRMPHVAALYRYPVKGFTPEPRVGLTVQADGRVAGDRVLAFRFANATRAERRDGHPYWNKRRGLALMTFPSLARHDLRLEGKNLTTHANPDTGHRDATVMPALVTKLGQEKPTVGVLLLARNEGGRIRVGESVRPT